LRVLWIELLRAVRRAFVVILRIVALPVGRAFLFGVIWLVWHDVLLLGCLCGSGLHSGLHSRGRGADGRHSYGINCHIGVGVPKELFRAPPPYRQEMTDLWLKRAEI